MLLEREREPRESVHEPRQQVHTKPRVKPRAGLRPQSRAEWRLAARFRRNFVRYERTTRWRHLAGVEVHRALRRVGASRAVRTRAEAVLSGLVLVRIDEPVLSRASSFKDPILRALDAIHLATALSLGDEPDAFITYDARLARAAAKQRLRVQHPGVDRLV
jgi:predicted nucleic acid-binding protein